MARVTRKWLLDNTKEIKLAGESLRGKILRGDIPLPAYNFDSTLSRSGMKLVENSKLKKIVKTFQIFIPGKGWADCYPRG
jgi:hypothetical protein